MDALPQFGKISGGKALLQLLLGTTKRSSGVSINVSQNVCYGLHSIFAIIEREHDLLPQISPSILFGRAGDRYHPRRLKSLRKSIVMGGKCFDLAGKSLDSLVDVLQTCNPSCALSAEANYLKSSDGDGQWIHHQKEGRRARYARVRPASYRHVQRYRRQLW